MTEHTSRGPRLQALRRLLEYALAESGGLGLAHMDKLLGAAALAVSDELDNVKIARSHRAFDPPVKPPSTLISLGKFRM